VERGGEGEGEARMVVHSGTQSKNTLYLCNILHDLESASLTQWYKFLSDHMVALQVNR
jgi:hypothetical protein